MATTKLATSEPKRVRRRAARAEAAQPVKTDSRVCFGLEWYAKEDDAVARGKQVYDAGQAVNGGWFHGMPCGRAPQFDYNDAEHGRLFAVTVA